MREEPRAFAPKDAVLRQHVERMAEQRRQELADPGIHPARQKVLTSLQEHWEGLTVFVEHPEVPLDNNKAERVLRGPVVLRKNRYGSGATWAGELAAMLFSEFQTLCLWKINPRVWLEAYLRACAEGGGSAPQTLDDFLPWEMSEEKRQEWSMEKKGEAEDSLGNVEPGQPVEVAFAMYPGRIFKAKVESVIPITGAGQLTPGGVLPQASAVAQRGRFAVRLALDDATIPGGAGGLAAIYTDRVRSLAVIRKVMIRMESYANYVFGDL